MKMTKTRKNRTGDCCDADIKKGDLYRRVTRSIGNPDKTTIEGVGVVHHGFRYDVAICVDCVDQGLQSNTR